MRGFRFAAVAAIVTVGMGLFGAAIGSCLGFALPSGVKAGVALEGRKTQGAGAGESSETVASREASVGVRVADSTETSRTMTGFALGLAFGLLLGAPAGMVLAILDQIVLLVNGWVSKTKTAEM